MELTLGAQLESTNTILNWMTEDGFALMDINVFPHMLNQVRLWYISSSSPELRLTGRHYKGANEGELLKSLMIYLWDNYIE